MGYPLESRCSALLSATGNCSSGASASLERARSRALGSHCPARSGRADSSRQPTTSLLNRLNPQLEGLGIDTRAEGARVGSRAAEVVVLDQVCEPDVVHRSHPAVLGLFDELALITPTELDATRTEVTGEQVREQAHGAGRGLIDDLLIAIERTFSGDRAAVGAQAELREQVGVEHTVVLDAWIGRGLPLVLPTDTERQDVLRAVVGAAVIEAGLFADDREVQ